jgi:hypothetical protein
LRALGQASKYRGKIGDGVPYSKEEIKAQPGDGEKIMTE